MKQFDGKAFIFTSEDNKYGGMYPVLLSEALEKPNVFLLERTFSINRALFQVISKLFYSERINIALKGFPSRITSRILSKKYTLRRELKELANKYSEVYVIFFNASIKRFYEGKTLQKIKKNYSNVKYIMFFLDPSTMWSARSAMNLIEEYPNLFEQIYTVDKYDAKKYGFIYNNTPYSKIEVQKNEENDIYFCGATKNRHKFIKNIINKLNENNIKSDWDVFYVNKKENGLSELEDVLYVKNPREMKPYCDVVKTMAKSKCILEIIEGDQSAMYTLRDYEAVTYGKKLLTNNKNIFEFPYYDERYMKYFESVEDIDTDWIKKKMQVNYAGDMKLFSPNYLLEKIVKESH